MKRYIRSNQIDPYSKEALIQILKDIKDYVYVVGSYSYGKATPDSDIDFYVRWKTDEERDAECEETGIDWCDTQETYVKDLIRYFESKGYSWDSSFTGSFNIDDTYIPLEFSAYYDADESRVHTVNILGVPMEAVATHTTNDKYQDGVKRKYL